MGISLRVFLVNDDDSIHRFALTRYERLLSRDPNERIAQHAGKRVRYILMVVDLLNREPVEILRVQYSYLYFDSEGLINPAYREEEVRLYLEIFPSEPIIKYPGQEINPKRSLPKKCHDDKYKWTPTPEIEAVIVETVFGKG